MADTARGVAEHSVIDIEGCIIDDDGNALDPITYAIIPRERLIKIRTGDTIHCFDLDTLYRSMYASKDRRLINPYNRQPFSQEITNRVNDYGREVSYQYLVIGATVSGGDSWPGTILCACW